MDKVLSPVTETSNWRNMCVRTTVHVTRRIYACTLCLKRTGQTMKSNETTKGTFLVADEAVRKSVL